MRANVRTKFWGGEGRGLHLLMQNGNGRAVSLDGLESGGRLDLTIQDEFPDRRLLLFHLSTGETPAH